MFVQVPATTTARYVVVTERLEYVSVVVVFAIGCQLTPLSIEDSQRDTVLPADWPDKVSVLTVLSPAQTVAPPATEPVDKTVTVCVDVLGPLHPAADAVIVAVPEKLEDQVTSPVEPSITPAAAGLKV